MDKVTLTVDGMTCMGCVASVRKVLEPMAGVQKVDVSLQDGKVTIGFDAAQAKLDAFKAAIEDAGYDVVGQG